MPKPFVTVELDRPRKLRYTTAALMQLEQIFETPMTEITKVPMGVTQLVKFLVIGLLEDDPNITEQSVVNLIDEHWSGSHYDLAAKVYEALSIGMGLDTKNKVRAVSPVQKASPGTGIPPSQSPSKT